MIKEHITCNVCSRRIENPEDGMGVVKKNCLIDFVELYRVGIEDHICAYCISSICFLGREKLSEQQSEIK